MGRYQHVAFALQQAGYRVIGYYHVGHGLSSGKRGDTDTPDQLTEHLQHMAKEVISLHTGLPLVLLGHSMGGLVVQRAAASDRSLADAVVMSSPALATFANALQKLLLATLPKWLPHLRVDNGLKLEGEPGATGSRAAWLSGLTGAARSGWLEGVFEHQCSGRRPCKANGRSQSRQSRAATPR